MGHVTTIGLDIAKSVFQVHGVDATGEAILRRRLTRAAAQPRYGAAVGRRASEKVAQERLGHSTITTTLDLYSHVTENMQQDAAQSWTKPSVLS